MPFSNFAGDKLSLPAILHVSKKTGLNPESLNAKSVFNPQAMTTGQQISELRHICFVEPFAASREDESFGSDFNSKSLESQEWAGHTITFSFLL